jgi:hypothetical protein
MAPSSPEEAVASDEAHQHRREHGQGRHDGEAGHEHHHDADVHQQAEDDGRDDPHATGVVETVALDGTVDGPVTHHVTPP